MIWEIAIAVATLLGNAFFVGAEFGLVSARRSSIELRALNGSRAARITLGAMEHVSLMLAGAQLGVTLCSLILGAVGEPLISQLLERPFDSLGLPAVLLHPLSFVVALIVMVYAHVVIGEMVPKNLALAGPDRTALLLTPVLAGIVKLIKPAVLALNALANGSLRAVGIKPQREIASTFTRDEVAGFVKESHREGLLTSDEEQLLAGALKFDERTVRSIVLPLDKVVTITPDTTPAELEALAADTGFSRFPVRTKQGILTGYIHLKDILGADEHAQHAPIPHKDVRELARVPARSSLRRALSTMQQSGAHLAQAYGAHNEPLGIVTLENVLEELVGEINDESQPVGN